MIFKLRICVCIVLLTAIFPACTKPDITFGAGYLDNSFTNIVSVDTATPVISTVYVDSFASSGTGKAVIGKYTDPVFGTVTAQSYFSVGPPSFSNIYSKSIYDSLELIIKPNKSYYGDTTQLLQINVNQLTQNIAFAENKSSLYNTNSFPVQQTVLGSLSTHVRPTVTDTIAIKLSDAVGADLLNKLRNADPNITTSDKFIEYFKGVRISAGSTSYMLGFADSIIMRLHYRDPGVVMQSKTIDFTLSNKSLQFNEIHIDRASTILSGIGPNNTEMPSEATNNNSFLQSATGTVIKVRFPYLRNFLQINQFVKVVRAQLVVKPTNNSFNGFYPLPPQIRLSQTTQFNDFGADITTTNTSGTSVTEYGDLFIDNLYGATTGYTYDITNYIVNQMSISENNENALLLSPPTPAYGADFNRMIVGNKEKTTPGVQLKLYYISVNK